VGRAELGFVAHAAELRVLADGLPSISGLTWSALVPARPVAPPEGDVGRATQPLREELAAAGVMSRESWSARATQCTSTDPTKSRMAIHHTASPSTGDPATRMRGIQAFHMDTRGWCDIGYHFVVSIDGTVWEGRSVELLGAHVGGHNRGNIGISLLGCFHTSSCNDWTPFEPPDLMVDTAGALVRVLAGLYGVTVDDTTLLGHRDHPDQATACPGDNLHARLGRIRALGSTPPGPALAAEWVAQSFPRAGQPFALRPGEEVAGYLELRNVGTASWEPDVTFLATTEPRDGASPLAGPDWIAPNRVASVGAAVPPGASLRFAFTLRAPDAPGTYAQFFNLVQDGVWFSEPDQGGPADDALELRVEVVEPGTGDGGLDDGGLDDGGLDDAGAGRPTGASGCGCRVGGTARGQPLALLAGLALAALLRRRIRAGRRSVL
jgi:MYXO-CTERM domain-containing protein